MGISANDQEDLCQHVFVHLWKDDFRCLRLWQATSPFSAYLGRIIANIAVDFMRRSRRL
ncbi:sigma factor, partial [Acinetobacter baumannii]